MLEKIRHHALEMNFKKRFLTCIIISLIAFAGFSVASFVTYRSEEAKWESQMETQGNSSSNSNSDSDGNSVGRRGRNDDFDPEEGWDDWEEPELSTADKVLMVSGGIVGTVLGIWYWVLCMIWAYRKAYRMGINRAVWVWATFFFNLLAIAVLYLYGVIRGTCYHCGKIRAKGELYCSRCGAPFTKECLNCGETVDIHDIYCPNCGEKITQPVSETEEDINE